MSFPETPSDNDNEPEILSTDMPPYEEGFVLVEGESGTVYKNRKVRDPLIGTRDQIVLE